jgi:ABC-2 type transport system permease protein
MARLVSGLFLALLTVGLVAVTAKWTTELEFQGAQWFWFFITVILGGIPFAALGVFLGTLTTPRSAVPVANLFYLPLSFAGGLWIPPNALSEKVQEFSRYLPTRSYGEIVWAKINYNPVEERWLAIHLAYSILFLVLAIWAYRRDEGSRFG